MMSRSVIYNLLSLGIIISTFCSCSSTGWKRLLYGNCSDVSCLNQGLLEKRVVHIEDCDKAYRKFLSTVDTSSRTSEKVENYLLDIIPEIRPIIKSSIKDDSKKITFTLTIKTDGSTEYSFFHKSDILDTNAVDRL